MCVCKCTCVCVCVCVCIRWGKQGSAHYQLSIKTLLSKLKREKERARLCVCLCVCLCVSVCVCVCVCAWMCVGLWESVQCSATLTPPERVYIIHRYIYGSITYRLTWMWASIYICGSIRYTHTHLLQPDATAQHCNLHTCREKDFPKGLFDLKGPKLNVLIRDKISFVSIAHLTSGGRSCWWALYR